MGPVLRGATPPFTPSGTASYYAADPEHSAGAIASHSGIVACFTCDGDAVARLLPYPLELRAGSAEGWVFLNETFVIRERLADLDATEPLEVRFKEAIAFFPCRLRDEEVQYHFVMYTDSDRNVYIANALGLWTKLATINLLLPFPPHPAYSPGEPSMPLKGTVSRFDQRVMTATFSAGAEIDASRLERFHQPIVGMRYLPDMRSDRRGAAVVHDLVAADLVEMRALRAWAGAATVEFGPSTKEELHPYQPIEMLESYYVDGLSYTNRGARVLHDYLG
jgi:acetoacetate decarboxylase